MLGVERHIKEPRLIFVFGDPIGGALAVCIGRVEVRIVDFLHRG